MKNLTICSEKAIDKEIVFDLISKTYRKSIKYDDQISIGKYPNSVFIWMPSVFSKEDEEYELLKDILEQIPFESPYLTHIDFHKVDIAKNILRIIKEKYNNLYVIDENENLYIIDDYLLNAKEY